MSYLDDFCIHGGATNEELPGENGVYFVITFTLGSNMHLPANAGASTEIIQEEGRAGILELLLLPSLRGVCFCAYSEKGSVMPCSSFNLPEVGLLDATG